MGIHDNDDAHDMAKDGDVDALRVYIAAGRDINYNPSGYATLLRIAVDHNRPEFVKLLIENNANIHIGNPLLFAACYGYTECVYYLLKANADFTPNRFGESPLAYASKNEHILCVNLLLHAGATV